jgi:hypothetical protein
VEAAGLRPPKYHPAYDLCIHIFVRPIAPVVNAPTRLIGFSEPIAP